MSGGLIQQLRSINHAYTNESDV